MLFPSFLKWNNESQRRAKWPTKFYWVNTFDKLVIFKLKFPCKWTTEMFCSFFIHNPQQVHHVLARTSCPSRYIMSQHIHHVPACTSCPNTHHSPAGTSCPNTYIMSQHVHHVSTRTSCPSRYFMSQHVHHILAGTQCSTPYLSDASYTDKSRFHQVHSFQLHARLEAMFWHFL